MQKLAWLSCFVLGSGILLSAQQPASGSQGAPATLAAAPVTLIGCVVGLNGGYSLNAASGKTYVLNGDVAQYSGQKVRAMGNLNVTRKPGANGQAEQQPTPTLNVTRVDKVADTCN